MYEDLSLGRRVVITVIIVVAILLALALYGYLTDSWEAQAESGSGPIVCVPNTETKEKIRAIMQESMEQALREHIVRLHAVWMKDDTGQPARATVGAQQGVRAYLGGIAAAKRWDPGIC